MENIFFSGWQALVLIQDLYYIRLETMKSVPVNPDVDLQLISLYFCTAGTWQ